MNISLSWFKEMFKSEKQKHLDWLKVREQEIKNDILSRELACIPEPDSGLKEIKNYKPYKKIKLVNDVLTIVLNDGSVISKPNATQADFSKARSAQYEQELFKLATSSEGIEEKRKEEAKIQEVKKLIEGIEILKSSADFRVEDNAVYLKGINRSLPELLVKKFIEIISKYKDVSGSVSLNEEYQALKRFFMWACLNPRAEVADQLYDFLVRNSFRITKQGFFVALRNVVTVGEEDKELVKFISEAYNKVKAVWKKKPIDFHVYRAQDGGLEFTKFRGKTEAHFGNLQDLYLNLPNMKENRFTDAHTETFDIRIGQVVSMPPEKCSWNTGDCGASGLHFTADEIHYVGCGDTSVLTLINPMKVVGIGQSKGRCYEYLPIMTVPRDEATKILHDLDFDTLELDEDFAIRELEDLANKAKEGFAVEAKKHSFNIPQISSEEVNKIVLSLEDMKKAISVRVVDVTYNEEEE